MKNDYQQCSISVMDNIEDPNISFDEKGISNYYYDYQNAASSLIHDPVQKEEELQKVVTEIKKNGKGKKYDCVIGISGGVDSSYVALKARELGLRALAVHFDNGWNSELSVSNIENIIKKLDFELFTYVVDWEEFKDLQLSYIKASVVDIEVLTDHAIRTVLLNIADKYKVDYILSGSNVVTEATLPEHWIFNKSDAENIKDIHQQYGEVQMKTFPLCEPWKRKYYIAKGIKTVNLLNYIDYNKAEAKERIANELNWKDYGGKHYESIFTRFYQGYILPEKFKIDKRKAHLSNLIFSGQISKEEAVKELALPIYPQDVFKVDKEFVLKKLGLSEEEFATIMKQPRREHTDFKTEQSFFSKFPIFKFLQPLWTKIRPYA